MHLTQTHSELPNQPIVHWTECHSVRVSEQYYSSMKLECSFRKKTQVSQFLDLGVFNQSTLKTCSPLNASLKGSLNTFMICDSWSYDDTVTNKLKADDMTIRQLEIPIELCHKSTTRVEDDRK